MEESGGDIVEQFYKRRRDLVLISFVLIVANAIHIQIGNEFSFFGVKTTIGRPELLPTFAFLMLVYFFVRYIQYMNEAKVFQHDLIRNLGSLSNEYRNIRYIGLAKKKNLSVLEKHFEGEKFQGNCNVKLVNGGFIKYVIFSQISSAGTKLKHSDFHVEITLSKLDLFGALVMAWLDIVILKKHAVDYVLPLLLGVLAFFSFSLNYQPGFPA